MVKQLYYEDIEVGTEIPMLTKHPTNTQLVRWAGAAEEYNPIHYDKDFALSHRLPGLIIQGPLKFNFLGQMMTNWIGDQGILRRLECNHRGMNFPNEDLYCKGKVTNKQVEKGEHRVDCEIWVENLKGEKTAPGSAVVILPSRS